MAGLQSSHSHTQTILKQVKAEQNQRFRAYGLISFPSARLVFEQSFRRAFGNLCVLPSGMRRTIWT